MGGVEPPTISAIGPVTVGEDPAPAPSVGFTVADDLVPGGGLTVTAASSNTALVPNGNLSVSTGGASRTLTMTPNGERKRDLDDLGDGRRWVQYVGNFVSTYSESSK